MNILGIDFEDWFHPELIQKAITSEKKEPKIIKGIDKILETLRMHNTFATFFVVGEILEQSPQLLDKIINNGHEIGFHTMKHTRLDKSGFEKTFDDELKTFNKLTNGRSIGFRAPTFSLNYSSSWIIDRLSENNYQYDSSVIPAKTNMYGLPGAQIEPYKISSSNLEKNDDSGNIIEFPLMVSNFLGFKIPTAGGFYLRFLPMRVIEKSINNYEKKFIPACIYIHSWEMTPEYMPTIPMPIFDNFITYFNIKKGLRKLEYLLEKFEFTSFQNYISKNF